jgi:putative hydrolase of the HAD superfamily
MRRAYVRMCAEEERRLAASNGSRWPEITLERVFVRLLLEAPLLRPSRLQIEGMPARSWSEACRGQFQIPEQLVRSDWVQCVASEFRMLSMCHLRLYPDTLRVLRTLREKGRGIWLLSNAQRCFTVQELEYMGLWDWFDGIRISSNAGLRKPDPQFMRLLLTEEGLDPADCVMIGNEMESDMAVAAACGVDGFYLPEEGHSLPLLLKEDDDA